MRFDVITVGTSTRDAFLQSREFHIDPDSHVLGGKGLVMPLGAKIEVPKMHFSTGGGSSNAAVTFSRQGFRVAAVSVVGDDVSGRTVIEEMRREKVFTGFIQKKRNLPTAYSILLHPPSGERTVLVHRGASESLSVRDIPWLKLRTGWFYISSLSGNIGLLKKLLAFAGKNNIRVAYNPGSKELKQKHRLAPLLGLIDVLILNREESAMVTGIAVNRQEDIFKKLHSWFSGVNVVSDGPRGVWVSDGTQFFKAGIYPERKIADRTGAGDAFGSGFVSGIMRHVADAKLKPMRLSGAAMEYAIKLGSANATSKVEGIGAKYGLLTRRDFETGKRWQHLPVKIFKV